MPICSVYFMVDAIMVIAVLLVKVDLAKLNRFYSNLHLPIAVLCLFASISSLFFCERCVFFFLMSKIKQPGNRC